MGNKHQPELPEMVFLLSHGNQKRKDFNNAVQKKFLLISKTKETMFIRWFKVNNKNANMIQLESFPLLYCNFEQI